MSEVKTTVVVISRMGEDSSITLNSLAKQTIPFNLVQIFDMEGKGANWARNKGFEKVRTKYVLFSDCDIEWEKNALDNMEAWLDIYAEHSYVYGQYEMGGKIYCQQPFDAELLRVRNYISTMSLIRSIDFPSFDESIQRLQDWDLWLTLLNKGMTGMYLPLLLFKTQIRDGITFGNGMSWEEAADVIAKKHRLRE